MDLSGTEVVIPGKRWEATREGVEDYTYLYLLQAAVNNPKPGADPADVTAGQTLLANLPGQVLADPDNATETDAAKRQILELLPKLMP
jgi:hypothetical protein